MKGYVQLSSHLGKSLLLLAKNGYLECFSAFLSMGKVQETGFIKLLKIPHYLSTGSASFPTEQNASPLVTTEAKDLILVELDGGRHSSFYNPHPLGTNCDQGLGGIS